MSRLTALVIVAAACASPEEEKAQRTRIEQQAIAATAASGAIATSASPTGMWNEPQLVNRLVRAGLAPQAIPGEKPDAYWNAPVLAYHVGTATLYAYIYPDSGARRRVTDALDTLSLAPKGRPGAYPIPHLLIVQNNLAAVLVGANERKQEQVALAIGAGLPVDPGR
jgi:hypothetical protein